MRTTVLNISHTDKTVNTSPRFFSPFFSHRVRIPLIPLSFSRYYNVLYQEKIISRTIQCFFSFLRLVIINHTMISTTTVIAANSYGYLKILTKHIFLFIISFIFLLQSRSRSAKWRKAAGRRSGMCGWTTTHTAHTKTDLYIAVLYILQKHQNAT